MKKQEILIFLIAIFLIFIRSYLFLLPKKKLKFLNKKVIEIKGVVSKIYSKRLILNCNYLKLKNNYYKFNRKILIYSNSDLSRYLDKGDFVILKKVYFKIPENYKIPGSFNYVNYLLGKQILFTGFLPSAYSIKLLEKRKVTFFERYRKIIKDRIEKINVSENIKALLRGIILGDKKDFSQNLKNLIRENGISHLFVISGLHVSIVFLFFLILMRIFFIKLNSFILPFIATIPFLIFYVLITGSGYPSIRALFLIIFGIFIIFVKRKRNPFRILIFLLFIFFIAKPFSFFNISLQFSFIIVFSIIYFYSRLKLKRWFFITIICFLSSLPLSLYYFNAIYPKGIIVNLFAIPFFTFGIIPLSAIYIFFPFNILLKILALNFSIFLKILQNLPTLKPLFLIKLTGFEVFIIYLIFYVFLEIYFGKKGKEILMILFLCFVFFIISFTKNHLLTNKIAIIKTRKTKAIVVSYKGRNILIDGGQKNLILSFLLFKNIHRLDWLILTNFKKIFLPSSEFLISNFKISNIYYPERFGKNLPGFIKLKGKNIIIFNKKINLRRVKNQYNEIKIY